MISVVSKGMKKKTSMNKRLEGWLTQTEEICLQVIICCFLSTNYEFTCLSRLPVVSATQTGTHRQVTMNQNL